MWGNFQSANRQCIISVWAQSGVSLMPLPSTEQDRPTNTQRRPNGLDNTHYVGTQAEELGVN